MLNTFRFALLAGLLAVGCRAAKEPAEKKFMWGGKPATVTFHVVDTYGNPLKYRVESFHDTEEPGVELANQFQGLAFRSAFTGKTYEFRLAPLPQTKKFSAFRERILVGEPSTFALFSIEEDVLIPDMSPFPLTQMVLTPAPVGAGPVWATVRPAFLPQVHDLGSETVAVDDKGRFTLHGLHGGRYVITVCKDGQVPKLALVDIPTLGPEKPIEVHLE